MPVNPESLKNLTPIRPIPTHRESFTAPLQLKITSSMASRLDALGEDKRTLIRAWIEAGLAAMESDRQSDLADDLIDELRHGVSETPSLASLIALCGIDGAVEVLRAIHLDYHHAIDWNHEHARAYALVAARELAKARQAEDITPTP